MNGEKNDVANPFILCDLNVIEKPELPEISHCFRDIGTGYLDDLTNLEACNRFNGIWIAEKSTLYFDASDFKFFDSTILNRGSLRKKGESNQRAKRKEYDYFFRVTQTLHTGDQLIWVK